MKNIFVLLIVMLNLSGCTVYFTDLPIEPEHTLKRNADELLGSWDIVKSSSGSIIGKVNILKKSFTIYLESTEKYQKWLIPFHGKYRINSDYSLAKGKDVYLINIDLKGKVPPKNTDGYFQLYIDTKNNKIGRVLEHQDYIVIQNTQDNGNKYRMIEISKVKSTELAKTVQLALDKFDVSESGLSFEYELKKSRR